MKRVLTLLAACALAQAVRAEVRIVRAPDGPALDVRPISGGTWTPSHASLRLALNPTGELQGDGYPGQSTANGRGIAAWVRSSTGQVVLQDLEHAEIQRAISAPLASGIPVIVPVAESTWLVAWTSGNAIHLVLGSLDAGFSTPVVIAGSLLGIVERSSDVVVVSRVAATGSLDLTSVTWRFHPTPVPIPVPLLRVPIPGTASLPCLETTGDGSALVAWSTGPREMLWIAVGPDAIDGPLATRSSNGSCQSLFSRLK